MSANAALRTEIAARDSAERQLRDLDRRKDEFLATLAHELRNPLAPIRHAVRLLDSPDADEEQRRGGRAVIARRVAQMSCLLDVSRITRGRLELRKTSVDPGSLIDAAVETAHPLILDIGMPDMNGYDVARKIRELAWGRTTFLMALTGWGRADDKERARIAGFDHHLTKPADPDEVARILTRCVAGRRRAS